MANKVGHIVWVVVRTLLLAVGGLLGAAAMLVLGLGPRAVHGDASDNDLPPDVGA